MVEKNFFFVEITKYSILLITMKVKLKKKQKNKYNKKFQN